jgi:hypothetical protein
MAHDVLYKAPNDEVFYSVDFTDDLPDDTSVSSSSDTTAVDEAGTDSSSTVVGTKSQSGMAQRAVLQAGTSGKDYTITFIGRGTTTSRDITKIVEMRVRTSAFLGNI